MAIVPLQKVTVYGTTNCKEQFLDSLQQLGCVHLVNLRGRRSEAPQLVSHEARQALRYLLASPVQRRPTRGWAEYDRGKLVEEVLEIKSRSEALVEERDFLLKAIADLEPWGDFRLPSVGYLGEKKFWFYVVPLRELPRIRETDLLWHVAHTDNQFAYIVVLAEEPPEALGRKPVELDHRPLSALRERLEEVEETLEELRWRRITLTRWRGLLQSDLDAADDRAARLAAGEETLDAQPVFALQGWVPRRALPEVRTLADQHRLALTVEPPNPGDKAPTLLHNPERIAGAEGCVTFYITPSYHAWDPTTIVYFSFSLFFAMIVADAGYGLLMLVLLLLFWRRLSRSRQLARFRNLLIGIISATIIYGVILGSYFGVEPAPDSLLARLQVRLDGRPLMENRNTMMVLAVAIGVAHLVLANVISAWKRRGSARWLGHVGWATVMLGAFLAGDGTLTGSQTLIEAGKVMLAGGGVAVLLFSSERPLLTLSPKTHALRLMDGVMQVGNISKAFGDVLSYLRLFALGLASAQLAVTFNSLAGDAAQIRGVGVLLALVILLVGHGINFLLGLMGGVVHGLRLNCIEFFNWSLTEEGYPFRAFRKKAET